MHTQVEKCNKMGGLRREFARLQAQPKTFKSGSVIRVKDMHSKLQQIPKNVFKFKSSRQSQQID